MIPDERLSSSPVPADFLEPDDRVVSDLEDWERGGVALSDPGQGLSVRNWRAYVEGDVIYVGPEDGAAVAFLTVPGVTQVSLSFDQNMRPQIAYTANGIAYLYWYDTVAEDYATLEITDAVWPRLALDDKRDLQTSVSDVILGYIRAGNLYYRQQRDRYTVEYLLQEGVVGRLRNVGMNRGLRLQFDIGL